MARAVAGGTGCGGLIQFSLRASLRAFLYITYPVLFADIRSCAPSQSVLCFNREMSIQAPLLPPSKKFQISYSRTANTIMTDISSMFSTGTGTPLYCLKWMPMSISAYAGTCIFLILLAIIFRFLIAVKSVLEQRWIDAELDRRYVVIIRKQNTKERISSDSDSKIALLTENGVEGDVMVVRKHMKGTMPWSITTDGPRAAVDVVIAGILYLL